MLYPVNIIYEILAVYGLLVCEMCMPPAAGSSEMLLTIMRLQFYKTKCEKFYILTDKQTAEELFITTAVRTSCPRWTTFWWRQISLI
jgi:hypothetical protein